jgi:allantoin racemase
MRIDVVMLISGVKGDDFKERHSSLQRYASDGTKINLVTTKFAPPSVDSLAEMELAAPGILERVLRSEREGADAVIIWGGHDPSLDSARSLVSIPVFAPGMASIYLAAMLSRRFSLIIQMPHVMEVAERQVKDLGLGNRCVGIYSVDLPVLELRKPDAFHKILETAIKSMEDGADSICFGCMALSDHAERLQVELDEVYPGVIVINPAEAVVKLSELVVSMGLSHSKRSYLYPPKEILFLF